MSNQEQDRYVHAAGRLTKDPELRYTPSGKAVCNLRLATSNLDIQNPDEAVFINVVVWEEAGEAAAESLKKGDLIYLSGFLKMTTFNDQEQFEINQHGEIIPLGQSAGQSQQQRGGQQRQANQGQQRGGQQRQQAGNRQSGSQRGGRF